MRGELLDIDHIHVVVADREAALDWYARVLGLIPVETLRFWAVDGGPMTIANPSQTVTLALFEGDSSETRPAIALRVDADGFRGWQKHLELILNTPPRLEDHRVSWSLYFADPDGNRFEITTYDYHELASELT